MALLYFIKNLQLSGQIARWLLLFLEYNFAMVYKPRCFHFVVNVLSQLLGVIENLGIPNKNIDASLLILQSEWLHEVHTYISTRNFLKGYSIKQRKKLVLKALPFTIIDGQLYKQRQDQILHQCLHAGKISIILWEMHEGVGG
jgi:hypothetical protein